MAKKQVKKHEKTVYHYPDGTTLVYYEQNLNKCTDVVVGWRIPRLNTPTENEIPAIYKNKLVFYTDENGNVRVPIIKPGLPHFVEHMFFSSLPDKPKEEIYDYFSRTNTEYNASTTQDSVDVEFNCPSKYNEEIFGLFSKMVFRDSYNKEDLRNEKGPVLQELLMSKDRHSNEGMETDALFGSIGSLTGEEILGIDRKIINTFNEKEMLRFVKSYFTKQNMVISVVSDRPFDEIKGLCDKYFVDKAPSLDATAVRTPKPTYDFLNDEILLLRDESKKTASISFVLRGTDDYESNEIYSTVEDFILNNFNGRLLTALRNHDGKVYTPYFDCDNLPGLSLKVFTARTTPKHIDSVLKTMTGILEDLATKGITDAEFEGFKEMWENRRERSVSVKHNSAWNLFEKIMYDLPAFVGQYNKKLSNITKEDVNAFLKETYSHAKCCLLISGNFNVEKLTSIHDVLKFRPLDRYMDEHYIDKELQKEFFDYLAYLDEHQEEAKNIKFIMPSISAEIKKLPEEEKQPTKKYCTTGLKYALAVVANQDKLDNEEAEELKK